MTMAYADPRPFPEVPARQVPALRVSRLATGDLGARETLGLMAQLVRHGLKDPVVLERAAQVVERVHPGDAAGQVRAIRQFLTYHMRYRNDPDEMELLQEPRYLLDQIAAIGRAEGDCDDVSILGATLGLAAGRRVRFVAVGFQGEAGPLSHVWVELENGGAWSELDVTRPIGETLVPPSRGLTYEVMHVRGR